jgi:hypothetical protein
MSIKRTCDGYNSGYFGSIGQLVISSLLLLLYHTSAAWTRAIILIREETDERQLAGGEQALVRLLI